MGGYPSHLVTEVIEEVVVGGEDAMKISTKIAFHHSRDSNLFFSEKIKESGKSLASSKLLY